MFDFLLLPILLLITGEVSSFALRKSVRCPLQVAEQRLGSSKEDFQTNSFRNSVPYRTLRPESDILPDPPKPKSFDWTKQWYPIAVDMYTDRKRPHKMQLLGHDIVLWHDTNQWRVFDDSCPHRGVPLSKFDDEMTLKLH